jgi:hypothetical protein
MSPQVVQAVEWLDSQLLHYGQSCKSFFHHWGIGRWEGACHVCNANAKIFKHAKTVRDQPTSSTSTPLEAMEAMEAVCPALCRHMEAQGGVHVIASCAITRVLGECWYMQFDPAWPPQPTAEEEKRLEAQQLAAAAKVGPPKRPKRKRGVKAQSQKPRKRQRGCAPSAAPKRQRQKRGRAPRAAPKRRRPAGWSTCSESDEE